MVDRRKLGRNSKARGKQEERNVLKLLQEHFGEEFKRNPDNGTKVADVESENIVVEVKSRQTAPWRLLQDAWAQAEKAAEDTGKEPYVIVSNIQNRRRVRWIITKLPESVDDVTS